MRNVFKKILLLASVVLVANLFISAKKQRYSSLPKENFVTVMFIFPELLDDCVMENTCRNSPWASEIAVASASGMAITERDGKTVVLTAGHFCEFEDEIGYEHYLRPQLFLADVDGNFWEGEIVDIDGSRDLCLIETTMPIKRSIGLSRVDPEIGERIYSISAPAGVSTGGVALHYEGFFSGCDNNERCFYTIPASFGSSGSLVLNSRNQVVGIVLFTPVRAESASGGVSLNQIREYLLENSIDPSSFSYWVF